MKNFEKVNFITKDGVTIVANYYPNQSSQFAGILIHQRPLTKESFDKLALFLQKEGYAVLAIDLRGHGESINSVSGKIDYNKFNQEEEKKSIIDLEAASIFLERQGFPKKNQFLIGASIGANLSFQFLSENSEVKAAVLLSPGLNYRGIALANFKKENLANKILIVAAFDDKQAIEAGHWFKNEYQDVNYFEYEKGGHGVELLNNHKDLYEKILIWLRDRLI